MILVENVSKVFKVPQKAVGLKASLRALFNRTYTEKVALKDVSLRVEEGEILGLLGANGAGKTTLVKALAGILYPTSGRLSVYGETPWSRRVSFRKNISLVMGQKAQLWWDLTAADCFELLREIYELERSRYSSSLDELVELLDLRALLNTQIRRLSLGERMKMELVAALLHRPRVVFLDEPTIGLDISSQRKVRQFLLEYRRRYRPIMILTSHYMEDIESLCERIVIMNQGEIVFDGPLADVRPSEKMVIVDWTSPPPGSNPGMHESPGVRRLVHENLQSRYLVHRDLVPSFAAQLLAQGLVSDLSIEEPDVGRVIEDLMMRKGQPQ